MNGAAPLRVLVADDEAPQREILGKILAAEGYEPVEAPDGARALALLREGSADLVLSDLRMPGLDGMGLLEAVRREFPDTPLILVTAFGGVPQALAAVRAGAFDFLTKPLDRDALLAAVGRAAERVRLTRENAALRAAAGEAPGFAALVGEHAEMRALRATLAKVAPAPTTLLLTGESGTGKELAARAAHAASSRARAPFIAINCAAIPEGLIESELFGHEKGAFTGAAERRIGVLEEAGEGTLLLDELGDLPLPLQPKLLRVLQERTFRRVGGREELPFRARVIAATLRDLESLVAGGKFRQDLFFRLNVIRVDLPPLRARASDIPRLAERFLEKYAQGTPRRFSPEALKLLMDNPWPGNVRQLEAVVERCVLLAEAETIVPADLPSEIREPRPLTASGEFKLPDGGLDLEALEKSLLIQAYERSGRNATRAAKLLGLSRRTMQYRLGKIGLLAVPAADEESGGPHPHDAFPKPR